MAMLRKVTILGGVFACAVAVGVVILLDNPLFGEMDDWRHRFPEVMFSVARAQLIVEEQLGNGDDGAVRNFVCEAFLKIPRGAERVDLAIGLHARGGDVHLTRVLG
jgi:hypothetical protein